SVSSLGGPIALRRCAGDWLERYLGQELRKADDPHRGEVRLNELANEPANVGLCENDGRRSAPREFRERATNGPKQVASGLGRKGKKGAARGPRDRPANGLFEKRVEQNHVQVPQAACESEGDGAAHLAPNVLGKVKRISFVCGSAGERLENPSQVAHADLLLDEAPEHVRQQDE